MGILDTSVQTKLCLPPTQVWGMEKNKFISVISGQRDTNQVAMKMTKEEKDKAHGESSHLSKQFKTRPRISWTRLEEMGINQGTKLCTNCVSS